MPLSRLIATVFAAVIVICSVNTTRADEPLPPHQIPTMLERLGYSPAGFGKASLFNNNWYFRLLSETGSKDCEVSLPHDWSVLLPMRENLYSCTGYLPGGVGLYHRWFRLEYPRDTTKYNYYLYFEGVYNRSTVSLNGQEVYSRPNGHASFLVDITPYVKPFDNNEVTVRVDHSREADCRWYTGSGINRSVWLVSSPKTHIAQWGMAYQTVALDNELAVVNVQVAVEKGRNQKVVVALLNEKGDTVTQSAAPVASSDTASVVLRVNNPKAWNTETPYLYYMVARLLNDKGEEIDRSVTRAGLRTTEFSPDKGFFLNGQNMKMLGVCVHDDAGALGTAVPEDVWRYRLNKLKEIGVNAIRMSHNPHSQAVYDLCDELGLLVMDEASDEWEFAKRKWLKGWNKGEPGYQGSFDFFEEWIERDVADMVRRDRCHPSVVLWSIGNEVDYPNDPYSHPVLDGSSITQPMYGGYKPEQPNAERIGKIAERLAGIVRQHDSSRAVTGALAGVVMSNETLYPSVVDVVGYNYTESRYKEDHERYPNRVIYGSENRHDMDAWRAVRDNDFIFGQFLWTGIDYLGESGPWPARGSTAGLLNLCGDVKTLGRYRQSLWSNEPMCYVVTHKVGRRWLRGNHDSRPADMQRLRFLPYDEPFWNYDEGDSVVVSCYTNAHMARLLLNGEEIGRPTMKNPRTGAVTWTVAYKPGVLQAEGIGGLFAHTPTATIETTGEVCGTKINVVCDWLNVYKPMPYETLYSTTDNNDHVFVVEIDLVDSLGRRVYNANNVVEVKAVGNCKLLALENGNIFDTSPIYDDSGQAITQRKAYNGKLIAYVKGTVFSFEASIK